jgi:hypothetical protein
MTPGMGRARQAGGGRGWRRWCRARAMRGGLATVGDEVDGAGCGATTLGPEVAAAQNEKMNLCQVKCVVRGEREVMRCYEFL